MEPMISGGGDLAFASVGEDNGDDVGGADADGTMLVTKGKPGSRGTTDKSRITCYNCGKKGHYSYECDEKDEQTQSNRSGENKEEKETETGTQLLMAAVESLW
jgi:hypothetical protein